MSRSAQHQFNLRLQKADATLLVQIAETESRSQSEVLRSALRAYAKRVKRREAGE